MHQSQLLLQSACNKIPLYIPSSYGFGARWNGTRFQYIFGENIWRPRIKDFEETFTGLLLEEEEKRKTYSWIDIGKETLLRHQFHRDITISQKMH